jgi:hypothetical protein
MRRILWILGLSAIGGAVAFADGPVSPPEAASRMTVPEGFQVMLFAGEPDVRQPIAIAIGARGRLRVAENYSDPSRRTKPEGPDRIVILEEMDHDGRFDKRKVEEVKKTAPSMMPEGLFGRLGDDEVRDLVAYLSTKAQVAPAPANP